jgi:hypothetical protein
VGSLLEIFAGLLDRSVEQIAAMTADGRRFDPARIGRIADIWDNNTFPLVSAAGAFWPLRAGRARTGLHWMAGLGTARRALMVELDPVLDKVLPAAAPEEYVHRDYYGQVRPGVLPVTDDVVAGLTVDYDLANASVRALAMRPVGTGLEVQLTLAAPRRFTPQTGYVVPDGSRKPWPAAPLRFTFTSVSGLRFDADDRIGMTVACEDAGPRVTIGRGGYLQATNATVWPDDPRWHESSAGQAADQTASYDRPVRPKRVTTTTLTSQQQAAARALVLLMIHVRLVYYYPRLAARVPVREICRLATSSGSAVLAASGYHGSARRKAFAELEQRWRHLPPDLEPVSIPTGPVVLRYAGYEEPHEHYDVPRAGSAVLLAAVPDKDAAAPWILASEEIAQPRRFHISSTAFHDEQNIHRTKDTLTVGDALVLQAE